MQSRVKTQDNASSGSNTRVHRRSTFALRAILCAMCVIVGACVPRHTVTPDPPVRDNTPAAVPTPQAPQQVADAESGQAVPEAPQRACTFQQPPPPEGQSTDGAAQEFTTLFDATLTEFSELLERTRTDMSGDAVSPASADALLTDYVRRGDALAVLTDHGWRLTAQRLCRLGGAVSTREHATLALPLLDQAVREGRHDDPCLNDCQQAVAYLMDVSVD